MVVMKKLAIIPARGGSKRIPRKNVKDFCGKPIMAYPIEAALKSGIFDEVMVSTDDEEIAAVARQYGASVPFMRSEATSNDYTPVGDVVREVLGEYEKRGQIFDYVFCLYATSAFTKPDILQGMMKQLQENPHISQTNVMTPCLFTPLRTKYFKDDGELAYMFPGYATTRTQDLTPCYHDAGIAYAARADMYSEKIPWAGIVSGYVVDPMYAQDVDTPDDWEMAEFKYEYLKRKGKV